MAFGTRAAVGVFVLTTALLPSGCGGGDDGSETQLSLTDYTCSYTGPDTVSAGQVSLTVENLSAGDGGFELFEIADDRTYDNFVRYVGGEKQRLENGEELAGPPSFLTVVGRVDVPAGGSAVLEADVGTGTHALYCFIGDPPKYVFAAAPLEVEAG